MKFILILVFAAGGARTFTVDTEQACHVGWLSSLIQNKRIVDYQCFRQEPHK